MGGSATPPPVPAPQLAATTATGSASLVPVGEAEVRQLPERLPEVTRPVTLTGTTVGQTADGATRVRTASGELVLKLATPLPPDRPVTVQITPAGQQPAPATATLPPSVPVQPPAAGAVPLPVATPAQAPLAGQIASQTASGVAVPPAPVQSPMQALLGTGQAKGGLPVPGQPSSAASTAPAPTASLSQGLFNSLPPITAQRTDAAPVTAGTGLRALVLMPASSGNSTAPSAGPAPAVILPGSQTTGQSIAADWPLARPGTLVPAQVLAATARPQMAPPLPGQKAPQAAQPAPAAPNSQPAGPMPAPAGAGPAPSANPPTGPAAMPLMQAAAGAADAAKPDGIQKLGGDAAHPGGAHPGGTGRGEQPAARPSLPPAPTTVQNQNPAPLPAAGQIPAMVPAPPSQAGQPSLPTSGAPPGPVPQPPAAAGTAPTSTGPTATVPQASQASQPRPVNPVAVTPQTPAAQPTATPATASPASGIPTPVPSPAATAPQPASLSPAPLPPTPPSPQGAAPAPMSPLAAAPQPVSPAVPAAVPGSAQPAASAHATAPAPPPVPLASGETAATPPEPVLVQGSRLALRLVSITPQPGSTSIPGTAPAAPPPSAAAGTVAAVDDGRQMISGTAVGTTPSGHAVIATPQGMLALVAPVRIPAGSLVTAQIGGLPPPVGLPDMSAVGPLGEMEWPAMRQLIASLSAINPALAQTFMTSILPQPNRKLGAAVTFLLSALRGGDARGWLGDDVAQALERHGQRQLMSQLERDFQSQREAADSSLQGDWRSYSLPFVDATGQQLLRLCVRPIHGDEQGHQAEADDSKSSRFLIDITLSQLGPMQLDGLVRKGRFDLILRTYQPLDPTLRAQLIQVYSNSLEAVGYTGGLVFQPGPKSWVKLARAVSGSGGPVTA